jgi:hypothetical protein
MESEAVKLASMLRFSRKRARLEYWTDQVPEYSADADEGMLRSGR